LSWAGVVSVQSPCPRVQEDVAVVGVIPLVEEAVVALERGDFAERRADQRIGPRAVDQAQIVGSDDRP
jgi:hypothetical protein